MEKPNKKFAGLSKKEKFKRVTDVLFKGCLIALCCSVAALFLYICFSKDEVQDAKAESASLYSVNDSTVDFFTYLLVDAALGPGIVDNESLVFFSGLPQFFDAPCQIFPSNKPYTETTDSSSYSFYLVDYTLEAPNIPANLYSNIFCVGNPSSAMDGNSTDMVMAFVDEFSDGSFLTTYYFVRMFARGSSPYYSSYGYLYTWTVEGTESLTGLQAIYSAGISGITSTKPYLQPRTIASHVGSDVTYILHPARANVVRRQILAKYRIDYSFLFFDYSLYGGDTATTQLAESISSNFYNNVALVRSIEEGAAGSGGVSQERYDSLLESYNLVLDQRDEWQRKYVDMQNQYNLAYQDYLRVDTLLADEKNKNAQLTASRDAYKADYERYYALYNQYLELNSSLENRQDELEETIASLEGDVSSKDTQISNLEAQITSLEGDISLISQNLSELQTSYNQLQTSYNQLQSDYDNVVSDSGLREKLEDAYDKGYDQGWDDSEAFKSVWDNIPDSVVKIWNGPIVKILEFEIGNFSLFQFLCGAYIFMFAFWILGKFI